MALASVILNEAQRLNVVVQIGTDYWSKYTPDSDPGALIPATNVGQLCKVQLPYPLVDVLKGQVAIPAASFCLQDRNPVTGDLGFVSSWKGANANALYSNSVNVTFWVGGYGAGQAFPADYTQVGFARIKTIKKAINEWQFNCTDVMERLSVTAFDLTTQINGDLTIGNATVTVDDTTNFAAVGTIKIGDEYIAYTGKTATTFTGCTRGSLSSPASTHNDNDVVNRVETITGNPVTIALQLMISKGGGGTYDVLDFGAAVPQAYVDTTTFATVAALFASNPFTTYVSDITVVDFISTELLLPLGLRLISVNGVISVAKIEYFDPATFSTTLDETSIAGTPDQDEDANQIVNTIVCQYDWKPGTNTYARSTTVSSASSVSKYGARTPFMITLNSVLPTDVSFLTIQLKKLLQRFANPLAEMEVDANRTGFFVTPGKTVRVVHRYLPQAGSGLGLSTFLEVVGASPNPETGNIKIKLQYASYSGYKLGNIAPAPKIIPRLVTPGYVDFDNTNVLSCAQTSYNGEGIKVGVAFTVRMIIWLDSNNPNNGLVEKGDLLGNQGEFNFGFTTGVNNQLQFRTHSGGVSVVGPTLTTGAWYYVEASWAQTAVGGITHRIYAALVGQTATLGGSANNGTPWGAGTSTPLVMGRYFDTVGNWAFAGRIKEFEYSNVQRNVADFVTPSTITPDNNTVTYYKCDDGSGTTIHGYFPMTLQGSYTWTPPVYNQSTFDLPTNYGKFYRAGYGLRLWRSGAFLADAVNTVQSVSGDAITVTTPWASSLGSYGVDTYLRFADFTNCSSDQQLLYAFVASNRRPVQARDGTATLQNVQARDGTGAVQQVTAFNPSSSYLTDGSNAFRIVP